MSSEQLYSYCLLSGAETEQRMSLLLSLCRFNENTQQAMLRHFVNGWSLEALEYTYGIRKPNLVRSINRLVEVNKVARMLANE